MHTIEALRGPKTAAPLKLRLTPRGGFRFVALRGPKTAAPLKLELPRPLASSHRPLRGPKTAAPLKRITSAGADHVAEGSPRSQDRGPIEARRPSPALPLPCRLSAVPRPRPH